MSTHLKEAFQRGLQYSRTAESLYAEISEKSLEARDLLTVPSLVSMSGLALVIHGSRHIETLQGVNEIAAGRGFDLLDGFVARALDQESDMGSLVDAGADKLAMGVISAAAWRTRVVPRHILATTIASNATNALLTTAAARNHPDARLRPSLAGKHSMALFNGSIISHAYASALEREHADIRLHDPLRRLGNMTFYAATASAAFAAADYAKRL